MPKAATRPSLPTSSSEFALPSSPSGSSFSPAADETKRLPRYRRPSLLAPKSSYLSEARLNSPLAASFVLQPSPRLRRRRNTFITEGSESDKERMLMDSSPSNGSPNPTPPEYNDDVEKDAKDTNKTGPSLPSTPPRKLSSGIMDQDLPLRTLPRRLSIPLRAPRIISLLAEARPEENEVKSEAAFQRLIHSCSELPMQPRTPRAPSDRGRYPEEAIQDDTQREATPSDDSADEDGSQFAFHPTGTEPIQIGKPRTPANSVNGDDQSMSLSESPGPSSMPMDVDMPYGSPSLANASNHWRYTPPPTSSAVRLNKRKFDDRYDPYPNASKRRAASPSISYLRENHQSLMSPVLITRTPNGKPLPIPITVPNSAVSSAASSPTIGSYPTSGLALSRPVCITSSPTMRTTVALASPILRPLPRSGIRKGDEDEREVEGTGEAVGGLSIAS